MRTRKWIRTVIVLLCMISALSFTAFAAEAATSSKDNSVTVKKENGKYYLVYTATGKKVTGKTGIQEVPAGSKNFYYFRNKSGQVARSNWIKKNNLYHYAGTDGKLKSGWATISKKIYYFNPTTLARTTSWKKIKGKFYFFTSKGVQVTKWLKWKNWTYYLDPADNNAKTIGWKTIDGKTYYFNSNGRLQFGIFTVDGKKYYSDKQGVKRTGLITYNGKRYYFDRKSGGAMKTGWVTVSGKKYYMSKVSSRYGQAVTGWMSLSGSRYYFNNNGVMQTGWLTVGTRKYYLDPTTGKMATGKVTISGTTYDFGTRGYITVEPTGPWSIKVNQSTCVVTIYRGTTPVKALTCSVGLNGATPTGTFYLGVKHRWHELFGNVYGQYTTQITGNILFHSVYYYTYGNNRTLSTAQYNLLGQPASAGCIRLTVAGAKYIYDNCPSGTKVTIFYGSSADDPLGKPSVQRLPLSQTWDPTDPNL